MKVSLTFDNGPYPDVTPRVLDILARQGVPANFFVVGKRAELPGARALMERATDEGHHIGNHTWSHGAPLGTRALEEDLVENEILSTQRLIDDLAGTTRMFRPNGGGGNLDQNLLDARVAAFLVERRWTCVLWNCVPRDWVDLDGWVETALSQCRMQPWSVVVLHDTPTAGALRHLDGFIQRVRDSGGTFCQDFPAECLPIRQGAIAEGLERYVTPGILSNNG